MLDGMLAFNTEPNIRYGLDADLLILYTDDSSGHPRKSETVIDFTSRLQGLEFLTHSHSQ